MLTYWLQISYIIICTLLTRVLRRLRTIHQKRQTGHKDLIDLSGSSHLQQLILIECTVRTNHTLWLGHLQHLSEYRQVEFSCLTSWPWFRFLNSITTQDCTVARCQLCKLSVHLSSQEWMNYELVYKIIMEVRERKCKCEINQHIFAPVEVGTSQDA